MGAMTHFLSFGRKFALASNVFFGVLSLGMTIAGFVLRFGNQSVNEATLQKIKTSAREAFGVYDLSTNNFRPITENLKEAFGIFLIVTGLVSAPLAVLGFYTFLRKKRNFLFAYAVITGFLVTIQLFVNFYFFKSNENVQEMLKPYLREKINEYAGIQSSDQVSLGWNYLMQEYQCCGVDSWGDFNSSTYSHSYCYYYSVYLVPGCCRTLPSSNSQSWCYNGMKYCGAYSSDSSMWSDGCSASLLRQYYTGYMEVIWSMIGVGLMDQSVWIEDDYNTAYTMIFLFVFAIILLRKTKVKVEPISNSAAEDRIKGNSRTTEMGFPPTTASSPVPLSQQGTSSSTRTQQQGPVILVPASHDYAHTTMPSAYVHMTLPGNIMPALSQTQAQQEANRRNYAPINYW